MAVKDLAAGTPRPPVSENPSGYHFEGTSDLVTGITPKTIAKTVTVTLKNYSVARRRDRRRRNVVTFDVTRIRENWSSGLRGNSEGECVTVWELPFYFIER